MLRRKCVALGITQTCQYHYAKANNRNRQSTQLRVCSHSLITKQQTHVPVPKFRPQKSTKSRMCHRHQNDNLTNECIPTFHTLKLHMIWCLNMKHIIHIKLYGLFKILETFCTCFSLCSSRSVRRSQ